MLFYMKIKNIFFSLFLKIILENKIFILFFIIYLLNIIKSNF